MNTGIQDAVALAWRLALAVPGLAAEGLLGSFDAERRPVGEEVVNRTVRHARVGFEADDPATMLLREAQLLVAYPEPAVSLVKAIRAEARLAGLRIGDPAGRAEFPEWLTLLGENGAGVPFLRYLPSQLGSLGTQVAERLQERFKR